MYKLPDIAVSFHPVPQNCCYVGRRACPLSTCQALLHPVIACSLCAHEAKAEAAQASMD